MLVVPAPKVAMTQADLRAANRLDLLDLISGHLTPLQVRGSARRSWPHVQSLLSSAGMIARFWLPRGVP